MTADCVCSIPYIVPRHAHRAVITLRHNQSESLGFYGDPPYQSGQPKQAQPRVRKPGGKLRETPIDKKHKQYGFPSQGDHDVRAKIHPYDDTN